VDIRRNSTDVSTQLHAPADSSLCIFWTEDEVGPSGRGGEDPCPREPNVSRSPHGHFTIIVIRNCTQRNVCKIVDTRHLSLKFQRGLDVLHVDTQIRIAEEFSMMGPCHGSIAGFSPRRPRNHPGISVWVQCWTSGTGIRFYPSPSVFRCQYNSTPYPLTYLGDGKRARYRSSSTDRRSSSIANNKND
jgi:hypothetical protein